MSVIFNRSPYGLGAFLESRVRPLVESDGCDEQTCEEDYEDSDGRSPPPPHASDDGVVEVLPVEDVSESGDVCGSES